ncbi:hypothetical protein COP2_002704 [Malus domestica]
MMTKTKQEMRWGDCNEFYRLIGFGAGCGFEPGIVTEFPAELWKKPKLNKYGVDEPHAEQVKCELTITEDSSKYKGIL